MLVYSDSSRTQP